MRSPFAAVIIAGSALLMGLVFGESGLGLLAALAILFTYAYTEG